MITKIIIIFRLLVLFFYFRLQLMVRDFKSCLLTCEKAGFLKTMEDLEFADKVLRKLLSWFPFTQGCLLHSLTLAKASQKSLEFYLSVFIEKNFSAHSFVKVDQTVFSTALHFQQDALPIWNKKC